MFQDWWHAKKFMKDNCHSDEESKGGGGMESSGTEASESNSEERNSCKWCGCIGSINEQLIR